MYALKYKKSALKALRKIPRPIAQRMMAELEAIALDPENYSGDWKPMRGKPYWRLMRGGYRVIFSLDSGEELVLLVLKVGARGAGTKTGSTKVLKALGESLQVEVDDLLL